jgi:hypothetical protein
MQEKNTEWKRYLIAFFITAFLFLTAFYLSNYFNNKKIDQIRSIENSISVDILSSETQYNLLSELSCNNVDDSILSKELNDLAGKIEYGEEQSIGSKEELLSLKKYYSLLQIKDFLLMQKAEEKCNLKVTSIIYFYSNKDDCADCEKQGFILTDIRQNYPNVRVYSFDYNLDLSAINALKSIYKINNETELPALVVNGKAYYGLQTIDAIRTIVPGVFTLPDENATTTPAAKTSKSLKAESTATTTLAH